MDLETYKVKFSQLTEQANKISKLCKSKDDLQKKISALSKEAVEFYTTNSDHLESDYQLKIEVFLEFDNFLKGLKKNFEPQNQESKKTSFFNAKKPNKKDDSYEDVPSLENSITL